MCDSAKIFLDMTWSDRLNPGRTTAPASVVGAGDCSGLEETRGEGGGRFGPPPRSRSG